MRPARCCAEAGLVLDNVKVVALRLVAKPWPRSAGAILTDGLILARSDKNKAEVVVTTGIFRPRGSKFVPDELSSR